MESIKANKTKTAIEIVNVNEISKEKLLEDKLHLESHLLKINEMLKLLE